MENQKIYAYLQCSKKNKVLTAPYGTLKIKIMYWKKNKNDICVEVFGMDEEGTKVVIREIVGNIHSKNINNLFCNETLDKEV